MRTRKIAFGIIALVLFSLVGMNQAVVTPVQAANWHSWRDQILQLHAPKAGCFVAKYPNVYWQSTKCGKAPLVRLQPSAPSIVGGGNDEVARTSSALIGSSVGSFHSITGLTNETDTLFGRDAYTLQDNSNFFASSITTPYTDNKACTPGPSFPQGCWGWEQFVFTSDGWIFIQYWLIGYYSTYGRCPNTDPPGGSSWMGPYEGSCYANSPGANTPSEAAANLANLVLKGYADTSSNDEAVLCVTGGECYTMAITDQVVDLYQHWTDAEFNVIGYGDGSEAIFNSGTSITVMNTLNDQSGNVIVPACVHTGYTGETNNLDLGSCSSNNNGYIVFTESLGNTATAVTFNTNPTLFLGASSAGSISACSGTFMNGQSSTFCGSSLSPRANLPSPSNQWKFDHWEWAGGISCSGNTANPTSCTVTSSGSLNAVYAAQITFLTNPPNPGSISWATCSNSGYTNGQTRFDDHLPPDFNNVIPVCANVPSGYAFSGWTTTGGLSVASGSNPTTTATFAGPGTITATFTPSSFTYSLSNSGGITVTRGTSGSNTITATLLSGTAGSVILSCTSGLPAGASCIFNPTSSNPTFSSTLTINTTSLTPTGSYTVTVNGSPSATATSQFMLTVNGPPPPSFSYSLSNSGTITVAQGSSGSNTITATLQTGSSQSVTLSCTGALPTGVGCSFSPASGYPTFSSTLTVSTTSSTPTGSYAVTVNGTPNATTGTEFTLTVNPVSPLFDFRLSNSGSSSNLGGIALTQGASGSITITGSLVTAPAQVVTLSCSSAAGPLPTGVSCSFNPLSAIPPFASSLTIFTTTSTPVGFYTLRVTGTAGSLTRSTLFILEVVATHSPLPPVSPGLISSEPNLVPFMPTGLAAERHSSTP